MTLLQAQASAFRQGGVNPRAVALNLVHRPVSGYVPHAHETPSWPSDILQWSLPRPENILGVDSPLQAAVHACPITSQLKPSVTHCLG